MDLTLVFQGKELFDSKLISWNERKIAELGQKVEVRMQNFCLEESQYVIVGIDCYRYYVLKVTQNSASTSDQTSRVSGVLFLLKYNII